MPAWPATVPFITSLRDLDYSGPQGDKVYFQPDVGEPKARRRSSDPYRTVSGLTPLLSTAQLATFEAFWEGDLAGGTLSFTAPHPVTGVTRTYKATEEYKPSYRGAGKVRLALSLIELPA